MTRADVGPIICREPWGNFSFFRTFVTLPFEQKDKRALEVIQVVSH